MEKTRFIGGMCAWEQEDYESINKELLKKAGLASRKPDRQDGWRNDKRKERVPSDEESSSHKRPSKKEIKYKDDNKWKNNKRSRSRSMEKDTRKWFHDKFDFDS